MTAISNAHLARGAQVPHPWYNW